MASERGAREKGPPVVAIRQTVQKNRQNMGGEAASGSTREIKGINKHKEHQRKGMERCIHGGESKDGTKPRLRRRIRVAFLPVIVVINYSKCSQYSVSLLSSYSASYVMLHYRE